MPPTASDQGASSTTAAWLHGLWEYYRGYTRTAAHSVATAALTALGLLVFINPLFAVLAIAAYVATPVVLYVLDADIGRPSAGSATTGEGSSVETATASDPGSNGIDPGPNDSGPDSDTDTDTDTDDGDSDSDSDSGDSDTDSDDGDTDDDA